jgi:hypothetical protein
MNRLKPIVVVLALTAGCNPPNAQPRNEEPLATPHATSKPASQDTAAKRLARNGVLPKGD